MYPVLALFFETHVEPLGICPSAVKSFLALCAVLDLLSNVQLGMVDPDQLEIAILHHLAMYQEAYGNVGWVYKHHAATHLPEQLLQVCHLRTCVLAPDLAGGNEHDVACRVWPWEQRAVHHFHGRGPCLDGPLHEPVVDVDAVGCKAVSKTALCLSSVWNCSSLSPRVSATAFAESKHWMWLEIWEAVKCSK